MREAKSLVQACLNPYRNTTILVGDMLALTKRSEYAVIALCHLAREPERVISAREISDRYRVPLPLLMNVLKSLQQNGLLRSNRGAQGGYRLSGDPHQLTLEAVLETVEGPLGLVQCGSSADLERAACELLGTCPIRRPMQRLNGMFRQFVAGVTIAELAGDEFGRGPETGAALVKVTTHEK